MISAIRKTLKRVFENITGMRKRTKTTGQKTETHFYGQIRDTITLNPGDKIHMYETRATTRKSSDPQYHLKVLRSTPDSDD